MTRRPELDDLAALARFLERHLRHSRLLEPPAWALQRAMALWSERRREAGAPGWLTRLLFDSATVPLRLGVRGPTATGPGARRLLYEARARNEAAPRQVDLRLRHETGGTVSVTGQCLPALSDAEVEVSVGDAKRFVVMSPNGEFLVRGLPREDCGFKVTLRGGDPLASLVLDVPALPDLNECDRAW